MCRGARRCPDRRKRIHEVNHSFQMSATVTRPLYTWRKLTAFIPLAWVNFLKQRLLLLHLDCKHVGAGRIVVMRLPHSA